MHLDPAVKSETLKEVSLSQSWHSVAMVLREETVTVFLGLLCAGQI